MAVTINGSTGVQLDDNAKQKFGTGEDLEIYHDGSDSYIKHVGTDDLWIVGETDDVNIKAADNIILQPQNGENGVRILGDGAVELYHNNVKKCETHGDGLHIGDGGNLDMPSYSSKIVLGASDDLNMFHDGTNSHIQNLTGDLKIHGANEIHLQNPSSGEKYIRCVNNGVVELYYDNAKKIETTSTGIGLHGLSTGTGNSTLHYNSSSGQVTYDTSSRLVKTDIADSPYGIDIVKQLKPRKYKRTDQETTPVEIGFIADEVQSLIPEIVPTGSKSIYTKNDSDTEIIPINVEYQKLTVVLTTALKEAITKIETLETKVAALEAHTHE